MTVIRPLPHQLVTSLRACVHPAGVRASAYVICFVPGSCLTFLWLHLCDGWRIAHHHSPAPNQRFQELSEGETTRRAEENPDTSCNALSGIDGDRGPGTISHMATWSAWLTASCMHPRHGHINTIDVWPNLKFIDMSGWTVWLNTSRSVYSLGNCFKSIFFCKKYTMMREKIISFNLLSLLENIQNIHPWRRINRLSN